MFDDAELLFEVYGTGDFESPMATGVSLYLYRVEIGGAQGRLPVEPGRRKPLPLELSFLLTAWADSPSRQFEILAWAMRKIQDDPILSSAQLNAAVPGVFRPEESIELVPTHLTNDELFNLWEAVPGDFRLSVPYTARVLRIDSEVEVIEGRPVLVRELVFGEVT
jgi:hypothetical protein